MFPILFHIGDLAVRSYTVLIDLGLLAGLALAYWLWRRRQLPPAAFLDAVVYTLLGGIIGSRAAYVATHWAYFTDHLSESFAIWTGGMSFHGAFVGGCAGLALYAVVSRRSFWEIGGIFSAGLALASIFGWMACLAGSYAYGTVGNGALFFVSPDIYGIEAPRFAMQPVSAVQSALILAILLPLIMRGASPGMAFSAFLILYFGGQAGLELLRGDESIFVGSWRLSQIVDLTFAAGGVLLFIITRGQGPADKLPPNQESATPAETS